MHVSVLPAVESGKIYSLFTAFKEKKHMESSYGAKYINQYNKFLIHS